MTPLSHSPSFLSDMAAFRYVQVRLVVSFLSARKGKWEYIFKKVASYKTSSMCAIRLLLHFMSESCWRKRFSTCGNQGKIVFVRVSGRILLHYQYLFALVQIVPSWHLLIHTHAQHRLTCVHRSTLANYIHFYSPSPAAFPLWLLL